MKDKASLFDPNQGLAWDQYVIRCPDVLEVGSEGQVDSMRDYIVGIDGCIALGPPDGIRVEGKPLKEVAQLIQDQSGSVRLQVRVKDYKSQQIYVLGQVNGSHRTVPYLGPETVTALLKREGGITPGASNNDIHVIRSHIVEGTSPEVFRIDLDAILSRRDESTNLILEPFDEVYVGQTRKSSLQSFFPPWLRPLYQSLCGLRRNKT